MRFIFPSVIIFFWLSAEWAGAQMTITANPATGCDTLLVQFGLSPSQGNDTIHSITWNFGNNSTLTDSFTPQIEYSTAGVYTVSCVINNNTTITSSNLIEVRKGPLAIYTTKDTLDPGSLSKFFQAVPQPISSNTYFYYWEFSDGLSYSTPYFIRTFPHTGVYGLSLTISDQTGCSDMISSQITAGHLISVPNVFTPNGDDINDYLMIRTNGMNVFSLEIYTRSGVMVYRAESPSLVWDGRSMSGHEMSSGIYYYVVRQVDGDAGIEKKGFVHLVR